MIKKLLLALGLALLPTLVYAQCAGVQTCSVSAVDSTTITNALNSINTENTTLFLPCGASATWTVRVTYAQVFSTKIVGCGSTTGSDSLGNPTGYNDQTTIFDNVADSNQPGQFFSVTTAAGKIFRITGVTFQTSPSQTFQSFHGIVSFTGNSPDFRFDHNHVSVSLGTEAFVYNGGLQGVLDHNVFTMTGGAVVNFVEMQGSGYKGLSDSAGGDQSWAAPTNFGTSQFVFTENNSFTVPPGSSTGRGFDCQFGGRGVFRNNTLSNAGLQEHGTGFDTRDRGCRAVEVYGNKISGPSPNFAFMVQVESGTGLWWNNTISGFNSAFEMDTVRGNNLTYTQTAPPNGWGYCGTQVNGSSSVWDQNLSSDGHACLDGIGMGQGDLLSGGNGGSFTGTVDNATGTQTWPNQALEPQYLWGNTVSGLTNAYAFSFNSPGTIENREWYAERPNFSNGAAFDGTAGVGCGPSAGVGCANPVARPTVCTAGVGYWNPAQNTLFKCAAGNVWNAFYTPYAYPHPLTNNATWGQADEWLRMTGNAPGTNLTQSVLTAGAVGTPSLNVWNLIQGNTSVSSMTAFTVGATQGTMGGSLVVNNTLFPVGTSTQTLALNNNNNFTYATTPSSTGGQTQVVSNGFVTFGATNAGFNGHFYDLVLLNDTASSAAVVLQFTDGQPCYCVDVETNGTAGFHRSSSINITQGHRYAFSLLFDEVGGVAKLAIFDPANNFSQVGLVTVTQDTGQTFASWRIGNAEAGTSAGTTTFFEDLTLDWTNHVWPNNPWYVNGGPNGWTYVQDSIITYCSSGTSCANFAGTMIPTLPNSVWVFYIDTASATSASVSGGGATWTECVACRISITNHHAFVFYAFGGTAGSTNFTVSTPGNSGSVSVNFLEVLPPPGTIASFDTSAVATPTCGGAPATCVGAGLTVSGTDFVYEFLDGTANPTWNNWPSPWLEIHTANAAVINATGTIAAPTVTVRPGFSGTAVFTAIAFTTTNYTAPAAGPMSMVQFVDPDPLHALNGLNCAPSCNLAVNSTGSNHLLYLEAANTSGVFLSSVSGGGTWVVPASCQIKGGQAAGNSLSCAYVLASTSGATNIAITMAGTANTQFAFYEVASSSGAFSFDTVNTATNAASFQPAGVNLNINQGKVDAIFHSISVFGGTSDISYYPYLRSCSSGCGLQFWNGQASSNAILNVFGSVPIPQWANQQNNSTVVSGVAFSVPISGVSTLAPPTNLHVIPSVQPMFLF